MMRLLHAGTDPEVGGETVEKIEIIRHRAVHIGAYIIRIQYVQGKGCKGSDRSCI